MKIKVNAFVNSLILTMFAATSAQAGLMDMLKGAEKSAETVEQTTQAVESVDQAVQGAATATVTEVAPANAQQSLSDMLMQRLGVSQTQAEGGAGALFQSAKQQMSADEFDQLRQAVPETDGLLAAAPKQSAAADSLSSGLSSIMGEDSTVSNAASVMSAFQQLNLSQDMIPQFTPIVIDYVKQQGGPEIATLLQAALTGL